MGEALPEEEEEEEEEEASSACCGLLLQLLLSAERTLVGASQRALSLLRLIIWLTVLMPAPRARKEEEEAEPAALPAAPPAPAPPPARALPGSAYLASTRERSSS